MNCPSLQGFPTWAPVHPAGQPPAVRGVFSPLSFGILYNVPALSNDWLWYLEGYILANTQIQLLLLSPVFNVIWWNVENVSAIKYYVSVYETFYTTCPLDYRFYTIRNLLFLIYVIDAFNPPHTPLKKEKLHSEMHWVQRGLLMHCKYVDSTQICLNIPLLYICICIF